MYENLAAVREGSGLENKRLHTHTHTHTIIPLTTHSPHPNSCVTLRFQFPPPNA